MKRDDFNLIIIIIFIIISFALYLGSIYQKGIDVEFTFKKSIKIKNDTFFKEKFFKIGEIKIKNNNFLPYKYKFPNLYGCIENTSYNFKVGFLNKENSVKYEIDYVLNPSYNYEFVEVPLKSEIKIIMLTSYLDPFKISVSKRIIENGENILIYEYKNKYRRNKNPYEFLNSYMYEEDNCINNDEFRKEKEIIAEIKLK